MATEGIDLRDGPVDLTPPRVSRSTFDLTFRAAPLTRVRVVAQCGAVGPSDPGWSIVVAASLVWITDRGPGPARLGRAPIDAVGPTTVTLHLTSSCTDTEDPFSHVERAFVNGTAIELNATEPTAWPYRLHAPQAVRTPEVASWLGGFTDAAGGHDDLRFGVDEGDEVSSVAWTSGHVVPPTRPSRTTTDVRTRSAPPVAWVFRPGESGYAGFRIPGALRTPTGAIVAFAEARRDALSDSCRTKHLVVKRSTDGGATWGPLVVAARYATQDATQHATQHANGTEDAPGSVMNPSPLVDARSGRIALVHSATDAGEFDVAAGLGRHDLRCVVSDDDGRSFGSPWSISRGLALPTNLGEAFPALTGLEPRLQIPAMGRSLVLAAPTAVEGAWFVAGNVTFGATHPFRSIVRAFWSLDGGTSWTAGPAIARWHDGRPAIGLNETSIAQRPDGAIVAHHRAYRDDRPLGCRAETIGRFADDGTFTWGEARLVPDLVESGVQGSLFVLAGPPARTFACIPWHPRVRRRLTVFEEDAASGRWRPGAVVDEGASAYSALVNLELDPTDVAGRAALGVLYERGTDGGVAWRSVDLRA